MALSKRHIKTLIIFIICLFLFALLQVMLLNFISSR